MSAAVADLCDEHEGEIEVCELQFRDFGGRAAFSGPIRTVRCHEDNSRVREVLSEPGEGRVLVIDGGGSMHCALVGDNIAADAAANGWAGVVVNGCVRDVAVLAGIDLGVKALGSNPKRSVKRGEGVVDTPVAFGGVVFVPGDMLYADADGVAVLSAD
ncbi:MAG: ribonuclease E activity regulator RraA [Phenylobacterium sp.]|jgi:regulator of ribonuclease activity A|uniref:ribonuclease E activity regulator RraA n=1 Tax=Phenylobacterium sp. TaxID=1871053 RepID=UPI002A2E3525|nr:ribonuclease E activity regulator RraA [Phenylobacterium sp.]MDD3837155.1 ribonuclease E activity regulator RraA [Phenylobacterium sp.]MDX9998904.1 ribonuclease E activity regulator RraA [Phenylobacterium sp.]